MSGGSTAPVLGVDAACSLGIRILLIDLSGGMVGCFEAWNVNAGGCRIRVAGFVELRDRSLKRSGVLEVSCNWGFEVGSKVKRGRVWVGVGISSSC